MAKKTKKSRKGRVRKNVDKQNKGFGYLNLNGANLFKPKPGKVILNFMSYIVTDNNHPDLDKEEEIAVVGEPWFKRPFLVHKNLGPQGRDSILCPRSFGKKCPICEEQAKMREEGADKDSIKALYPQRRTLFLVVPTNNDDYEKEEVGVWDVSDYKLWEPLCEEMDEDGDYEDFIESDCKYSPEIRFKDSEFNDNKFVDVNKIDFKKRKLQFEESEFVDMPNLDKMLKEPSYEEVRNLFFGIEEDEDDKPKKKRKKKKVEEEEPEQKKKTGKTSEKDTSSGSGKKRKKKADKEEEPKGKKKNKCPHGHKFGKDHGDFDDCAECKLYKKCGKAS